MQKIVKYFVLCFLACTSLVLSNDCWGQQDSVRMRYIEELTYILKSIEDNYIDFKRGYSEEEYNCIVDSLFAATSNLSTRSDYYSLLRKVSYLINDAHLSFPDEGVFNRVYFQYRNHIIFPVWVKIAEDGRVYVVKDYTGNLHVQAEILSINGLDAKTLALDSRAMMPAEERYAVAWNNSQNEPDPRVWNSFSNYLFFEKVSAPYLVDYREYGDSLTKSVSIDGRLREEIFKEYKQSRDKSNVVRQKGLRMQPVVYRKLEDNIGLLEINVFWGKNYASQLLFAKDWRFSRLLRRNMRKIARDNIEHLILDIRNNPGGSAENVLNTLDYFINEPIDRSMIIRVTDLSREIAPIMLRNEYKSLGVSKDDIERSLSLFDTVANGTLFRTDSIFPVIHTPSVVKHEYEGKLYLLTGPMTYSAGIDFANLFNDLNMGLIAGESPGGYRHFTSGNTVNVTLPYSQNIPLKIPYTCYSYTCNYSDKHDYLKVDIPIKISFENWFGNQDGVIEELISIIKNK